MAIEIKTIQELADKNLANFEGKLNQDSPLNDIAFLITLSAIQALAESTLYKYGQNRGLQSLAATADLDGLKEIGEPYGVIFKEAEAAVLNISLPAVNGTIIPDTAVFIGDNNGERYTVDSPATAAGGVALLTVTAENPGANGNLDNGETLTIRSQIAGAESVATVLSTETVGAEEENFLLFKRRVFTAIRRTPGQENLSLIREWGEEVPGVAAVFPFTGRPYNESPELSVPPERTIYVQATTDIDPDGIAPPALLDDVRASLLTNPETGKRRMVWGMTDEFLYTRSIERITFYSEVRDLFTPAGQETQVQTAVDAAVEFYYFTVSLFVEGLDFAGIRNDLITDLTLSKIIQDILQANDSSADGAGFGTTPGVFLGRYQLLPGQLGKSGGVTYA